MLKIHHNGRYMENGEVRVRNNKRKIKLFSFFAGAGFLDLGFEKAGFDVAFVNELNPSFLKAYKYARTKMHLSIPEFGYFQGDMAKLTKGKNRKLLSDKIHLAKSKGNVIGFIGGPPCPDFSVAGKNKGRKGHHGKLSETYTKLISQQHPDFFLFENVKGLWRTKYHREYYEELKNTLEQEGYILTEKLINALEYGVPQDRDRIILIGFTKSLIPASWISSTKEHFLKQEIFPWSDYTKYEREEVFNKYKSVEKKYSKTLDHMPSGIPGDTTVTYWFQKNDVEHHPNSNDYFKPKSITKFQNITEGDVSRKSFKRLHRWKYSPTVAYGNNEVHLHPYFPRRLSVAEALSLQSLPKSYSFPEDMTLSDKFKAIGNGVPFVAANGVAKSVKKFINSL